MRSGWPTEGRDWNSEYYRTGIEQLTDRNFSHFTFAPRPALRARMPMNGYRVEREYTGGDFSSEEWELIDGRWDHQHCTVCYFRIEPDHTYWSNGQGLIICDTCHEYVSTAEGASPTP
jgi:hypothetical protein